MTRDIKKVMDEYNQKFIYVDCPGKFYPSDVEQIIMMAKADDGKISAFTLTLYALEVGFMIGYRAGKRKTRAKARPQN